MNDHDKHDLDKHDPSKLGRDHLPGRAIVARFESRAEAREAIAALHKAKYTHTWLGTTSVATTDRGDEAVTVESGGFFSGAESMTDALVKQGVHGDTARMLESKVQPGNALLTLDPKDEPEGPAIEILQSFGAEIAGPTLSGTSLRGTSAADVLSSDPSPAGRAPARTAPRAAFTSPDDDLSEQAWEETIFERRY